MNFKGILISLPLLFLLGCGEWVDVPPVLAKCNEQVAEQWSKRGHGMATAVCGRTVSKKYSGEARCDGDVLQVLCE